MNIDVFHIAAGRDAVRSGIDLMRAAPVSANSAAARSSRKLKALPSPNHSSSWTEAPPTRRHRPRTYHNELIVPGMT